MAHARDIRWGPGRLNRDDLRRRPKRPSPDRRRRSPDTRHHVARRQRANVGRGVLQVREPAACRGVQVPRRIQRALPIERRCPQPRRRRLLFRKSRAGGGARRQTPRHPVRHRHATRCSGGEACRDGGIRRRSRRVRSRARRSRSDRPPPRGWTWA